MTEQKKSYQDVAVVVSARVYDENSYGNAQAALEFAVRKAWGKTFGNPRAANSVGELLPGDDTHAVIRIAEILGLSDANQTRSVQLAPGTQQFRLVPEEPELDKE